MTQPNYSQHGGPPLDAERLVALGQEMRAVHRRLRDALDIARTSIENDELPESLAFKDLQLYCGAFCVALNGHHTSEDGQLFPLVLGVQPDLAPIISTLMQDHSMIAHLIRGLENGLRMGDDKTSLARHLDGIEAVMQTHFRFEERQLVNLLDTVDSHGLDKTALFGPIA